MPVPVLRLRREVFGYTIAFASGDVDFYSDAAGPLLLQGATREELEACRIEKIPITENFHLSAPLIVWFEITRACNLPCKHCYVEAGPPRHNELTTPEILTILDQLKVKGVFALVLVGGEPMLHPNFVEIVNYAHDLGFVISIASNGTYITQELIDKLPREECIVSVSIDGIAFQKELRGKTTFEEIRDNLLMLKRNHFPAAIMTTLTSKNVDELYTVFDFAQTNDFFFGVAPFSPLGRGRFFPQFQPLEDVVEKAAELFIKEYLHEDDMMKDAGLCVTRFLYKSYKLSLAMRREFCGISLAYILSDGSVYPCSVCSSAEKYKAGNLREESFDSIWENSFGEIRSITFDSFKGCSTCELSSPRYFCTARCPVMSEIYTGDPLQCGSTPYLKLGLKRKTELLEEYGLKSAVSDDNPGTQENRHDHGP